MMSGRRDRVLHLQVETEEMYGVFSPDRSRLLTGGDGANPKVHVWDVETGRCLRVLNGHKEPVAALCWAEDQRLVASGAFDREVRLWDVASGECLLALAGHRSYVRSVDFSQSRERLLSGSGDGVVRLWELATGKMLQQFQGHRDGVYHAVFDASQTRVLSGGRDRTIRLWEASTGRCLQLIDAKGAHVQCLAWHSDQRRFLSCAGDIRLWDSESGECLRVFEDTRTQFDPSLGVTISSIFYRPRMTALCGFGNPGRVAALQCSRATRSALSTQSGPSIAHVCFPATPAADCERSPLT